MQMLRPDGSTEVRRIFGGPRYKQIPLLWTTNHGQWTLDSVEEAFWPQTSLKAAEDGFETRQKSCRAQFQDIIEK